MMFLREKLTQYHKLAREQEGLINANCLAHARRHYANAINAMGKGNPEVVQASVAYKALAQIGAFYDLESTLKDLSPEERLKERQTSIKPLIEAYFTWVKEVVSGGTVLPKTETGKGLQYSITETARANRLNVYYIKHLLTELLQLIDKAGNIEHSLLEPLMPWSKSLPADCYSKRRN